MVNIIDDKLSKRFLELDPAGYFIIYLDRQAGLICAKHFTNEVNEQGLAVDPETGKPIPATVKVERQATALFTGRSAKEICIQLFEETKPCPVSRYDHAAYLGREFIRAELALVTGKEYIQD
jgi:dihydropteroate synthase